MSKRDPITGQKPLTPIERENLKKKLFFSRVLAIIPLAQLRKLVKNYVFSRESSDLKSVARPELIGLFLSEDLSTENPEEVMTDLLENYMEASDLEKLATLLEVSPSIPDILQALKIGVTAPLTSRKKRVPVQRGRKTKQKVIKKISRAESEKPSTREDSERNFYFNHVVDFLAGKYAYIGDDLVEQPGQSMRSFAQEREISFPKFSEYFKILKEEAAPYALYKVREREEARLVELRSEIPSETVPSHEVALLEQLASLPLSDTAQLTPREEDLWLRIAEDVSRVGLADVVAGNYLRELGIPQSISGEDAVRIALKLIENRLKQLGLFNPPSIVSFAALRDYIEPPPPKPAKPLIPVIPAKPAQPNHLMEEELLRQLEEEERRSMEELSLYLDTPEERSRRRSLGWVLPASLFSRDEVEELRSAGALFERGEWLLPSAELFRQWRGRKAAEQHAHQNKPKLLIVGGKPTYPKRWMFEEFDVKAIHLPVKNFDQLVDAFQPDAMFTYLQATARPLISAASTYSSRTGVPLIRFHKGFSDAIEDARRQGLTWFVDAFFRNTRHNPLRRAEARESKTFYRNVIRRLRYL